MSSIMRRRSGLTASTALVKVMGGSGLEVGVLDTLDPQAGLPARHPQRVRLVTGRCPTPPSRASGFVPWPTAAVCGNAAGCRQSRGKPDAWRTRPEPTLLTRVGLAGLLRLSSI